MIRCYNIKISIELYLRVYFDLVILTIIFDNNPVVNKNKLNNTSDNVTICCILFIRIL